MWNALTLGCVPLCMCRATLHSFFRTEDNIFREMLLEEEQEGATWQQAQVQSGPNPTLRLAA